MLTMRKEGGCEIGNGHTMAAQHLEKLLVVDVETRRGIFIFRVAERRVRKVARFHDVRTEVERDYLREKARRRIIRQRDELRIRRA